MSERVLRIRELREMVGGISRRHIDALEQAGKFPKRIHISERAVGWLQSEIEAWIKQRAERRDQ